MKNFLKRILKWFIDKFGTRFISYLNNEIIKSNAHSINAKVSEHSKLYAPYRIENTTIGDYTYLSQNSKLINTTIGKFCSVGPNFISGWGIHPVTKLTTSPMFYSTKKQNGITLSSTDKIEEVKPIIIGNDVFIGMNVIVLDGVQIGDGAIIGAGAVVSKNIPPYAVAVGSPIQIIKYRHAPDTIEKLLQIKWWDWDLEKLNEVEKYFDDVDGFVKKYS